MVLIDEIKSPYFKKQERPMFNLWFIFEMIAFLQMKYCPCGN